MARRILNTLLVILVYVFSYFATSTKLLGPQTTNLGNAFPFSFLPPGVVFMVARTLIFVLLGIFVIYMWRKYKDEARNKHFLNLFAMTSILNIARLIATAQQLYVIAFMIMLLLFLALAKMLDILKNTGRNNRRNRGRVTFGAYYGWVSVATWALGLSQVIYIYARNFALSQTRAWIAIGLGALITILSRLRWKNIYALLFSLLGLGGALWAKCIGR